MTKRLYYEDAYCREFNARVTDCREGKRSWEVTLDQTAFYPEGGGQPSDRGWINAIFVKDVYIKDDTIYHVTEEGFQTGDQVQLSLDFDSRFALMQQHRGEHMLSSAFEHS